MAFLATLVTPYGLGLYEFLWTYKDTYFMTHIVEWLPVWYFPMAYWRLLYMSILSAGLMLFILKQTTPKKIKLWDFFLAMFFIFLFLTARRHFPLLFIVSFPLTLKIYGSIFDYKFNNDSKKRFFTPFLSYIKAFLIIVLIAISVILGVNTRYSRDPFQELSLDYPAGAIDFLKSRPELEKDKIFNEYGWGGYLIWTYPERKLFIDGRLPQYPFNGHSFLEEYQEFYKKGNLPEILNRYNIRLVLIRTNEKDLKFSWLEKKIFGLKDEDGRINNELADFLKNSSDWKEIYRDETAVIYKKQPFTKSKR